MKKITPVIYTCIVLLAFACKKPDLSNIVEGTVTGNSGFNYRTVTLGEQVWMAENLQSITFSNGDSIFESASDSAWAAAQASNYCYPNNYQSFEVPTGFGKQYNYQTANNSKNICPQGWHLPSDNEWDELVDFLGGKYKAGEKLKEASLGQWFLSDEITGTDESKFSAAPTGYRTKSGNFYNERFFAYFWTSALDKNDSVKVKMLHYGSRAVSTILMDQNDGASVRCIQD